MLICLIKQSEGYSPKILNNTPQFSDNQNHGQQQSVSLSSHSRLIHTTVQRPLKSWATLHTAKCFIQFPQWTDSHQFSDHQNHGQHCTQQRVSFRFHSRLTHSTVQRPLKSWTILHTAKHFIQFPQRIGSQHILWTVEPPFRDHPS